MHVARCSADDYGKTRMRFVVTNTSAADEPTPTATGTVAVHTHDTTSHTTKQPRTRTNLNAAGNTSRCSTITTTVNTQRSDSKSTYDGHYEFGHAHDCMCIISRKRRPITLPTPTRSRPIYTMSRLVHARVYYRVHTKKHEHVI